MDPIGSIHYKKDSTLAMLFEAERRGWEIYYFEQHDLFLTDGAPYAHARLLKVFKDPSSWFSFHEKETMALSDLNVILMRKDPPFNDEYVYTTHLLDHAEQKGTLIVNCPQALRDYNEKLFATFFPACTPHSMVSRSINDLRSFWQNYRDIVCKPLDSMGGVSVFRIKEDEVNANVIFETLTKNETRYIMAQEYISDIKTGGDKRILIINGEPVPFALARVPQGNDWRGNLAVGAKGVIRPLTERDRFICEEIKPTLLTHGLLFVGIDVIGDFLTEINITSPTGIRELDQGLGINISATLFDAIEQLIGNIRLV
jgi:glutathione synthase